MIEPRVWAAPEFGVALGMRGSMFEIPAAVKAFEQSTLPALQPAASDVFDSCEDLQLVRTRGWSRQTSDDSESSSYSWQPRRWLQRPDLNRRSQGYEPSGDDQTPLRCGPVLPAGPELVKRCPLSVPHLRREKRTCARGLPFYRKSIKSVGLRESPTPLAFPLAKIPRKMTRPKLQEANLPI